jgi:hypothetical protein
MKAQGTLAWLLAAAAVSLTACGSSSSPASTTSPKPSKSAASSASATQKLIAADWTAFFSGKTPVSRRVTLVQDGTMFAPLITAQSHLSLARQASAKVTKVTVTSPTMAKVTYSILESGAPVLTNKTGVAVYQDHTWKVGVASFCGLLAAENNGNTAKLPAACKSAG